MRLDFTFISRVLSNSMQSVEIYWKREQMQKENERGRTWNIVIYSKTRYHGDIACLHFHQLWWLCWQRLTFLQPFFWQNLTSKDLGGKSRFANSQFVVLRFSRQERCKFDLRWRWIGFIIPLIEGAGVTLCGCNTCIQLRKKKINI